MAREVAVFVARTPSRVGMAPHLKPKEFDLLRRWSGKNKLPPVQVHAKLKKRRDKQGIPTQNMTNIRKAFKGMAYQVKAKEKRGLPGTYTRGDVLVVSSSCAGIL